MSRLLDRLAAAYRREQHRIRASFLAEYIDHWEILRTDDLDASTPSWLRAVMRSLRAHRQESAEAAATHHVRMRLANASPIYVPPPEPLFRDAGGRETIHRIETGLTERERERVAEVKAKATTERVLVAATAQRETGRIPPPERRATVDWDNPRKPVIDWGRDDRVAETALTITGPNEVKRRVTGLEDAIAARRAALALSSGTATRMVLGGGRRTGVTLVQHDEAALGWTRVTGQSRTGPCSFCVMLASRGLDYRPYRTRGAASFKAHDTCQCTAQPVFSRDDWPHRDQQREWKALWDEVTREYSGDAKARAFRRHWERLQREGQPLPGLREAA